MEISIQRRSQGDGIPSTADTETRNSASACKIALRKQSESSNREVPSTDPFITGFRLVDMEVLNFVLRIYRVWRTLLVLCLVWFMHSFIHS